MANWSKIGTQGGAGAMSGASLGPWGALAGGVLGAVGAGLGGDPEAEALAQRQKEFEQTMGMNRMKMAQDAEQAKRSGNMAGLNYLGQMSQNADALTRRRSFRNAILGQ